MLERLQRGVKLRGALHQRAALLTHQQGDARLPWRQRTRVAPCQRAQSVECGCLIASRSVNEAQEGGGLLQITSISEEARMGAARQANRILGILLQGLLEHHSGRLPVLLVRSPRLLVQLLACDPHA